VSVAKKPNRLLAPFYDRLPAEFDSFSRRGTSLIKIGQGRLLYGFHFDPTAMGQDLRWVHYFVQPLYEPTSFVGLQWGDRIARNPGSGLSHFPQYVGVDDKERIKQTIHHMRVDGLRVLNQCRTLSGFYELLVADEWRCSEELYWYEALASTAILLGKCTEALSHIGDGLMEAALNPLEPGQIEIQHFAPGAFRGRTGLRDWELAVVERLKLLRSMLQNGNMEGAVRQIDEWQRFTVAALKIEDLLVSGG
jgi:hypothetical protein